MVNKIPSTYTVRTPLKNLFSHLSECRRVALRTLPTPFFVTFFGRVIDAVRTNVDYRDLIKQAYEQRAQRDTNASIAREDMCNVTLEILDEVLDEYKIENKAPIIHAYKEFLNRSWYFFVIMYEVINNIPNEL